MSTANPLVAAPIDTATPLSGAGILDSGEQLAEAIRSGDWAQGTMAGVGVALDTVATVLDPLGSLIGAGLGWLIDHLEPLKGWFNDFTGDAGEVAAFGQTWANVETQLRGAEGELIRILSDIEGMEGEAIDAYVRFQHDSARHLGAAASWAGAMSTGMQIASTIVQIVHDIVRDVLSQLVGSIIAWAAEAIFTLGLATPVIVAQVSSRVSSWVTKIGKNVTDAISSCRALSKLLDEISTLMKKGADVYSSVLKGAKTTTHNVTETVAGLPGIRRLDPRRNDLIDNMTRWADDAKIPGYKPYGDLTPQQFLDQHLKQFTESGFPDWRWPRDDGFDMTVPRKPANSVLLPGDQFDRLSPMPPIKDQGQFASPPGTQFPTQSLPPDRLSPNFQHYTLEVVKPLPDNVLVGRIAGDFQQPGQGIQYFFPGGIAHWVEAGYIKLVP